MKKKNIIVRPLHPLLHSESKKIINIIANSVDEYVLLFSEYKIMKIYHTYWVHEKTFSLVIFAGKLTELSLVFEKDRARASLFIYLLTTTLLNLCIVHIKFVKSQ